MKRNCTKLLFSVICGLFSVMMTVCMAFAEEVTGPEEDQKQPEAIQIPIGSNEHLRYFETETEGMSGIDFMRFFDDKVAICRSVSHSSCAIEVFHLDGTFAYEIPCEGVFYMLDMEYYDNCFYVTDIDRNVWVYSKSGELLDVKGYSSGTEDNLYALMVCDGALYRCYAYGDRILYKGIEASDYDEQMERVSPFATSRIVTSYSYLGETQGNLYYIVEEFTEVPRLYLNYSIQAWSPEGEYIGKWNLPSEDSVYYPLKYYQILSDGTIAVMRCLADEVRIDFLTEDQMIPATPKPTMKRPSEQSVEKVVESVLCPPEAIDYPEFACETSLMEPDPLRSIALSRSQVITNAMSYVYYSWTLNSSNKVVRNPAVLPSWISSITTLPHSMTGVPYCWGGCKSLAEFNYEIGLGYMAGNIYTGTTGQVSQTTGVDCSGFLTKVYNDSYQSTYSLVTAYPTTTWSGVCLGDYLLSRSNVDGNGNGVYNGSNHVMIYHTVPTTGYILIVDSSTGTGKTSARTVSKSTLVSQDYVPHRPFASGHTMSSSWSHDATWHWHTCSNNCNNGVPFGKYTHTFSGNTCTVCGYTK